MAEQTVPRMQQAVLVHWSPPYDDWQHQKDILNILNLKLKRDFRVVQMAPMGGVSESDGFAAIVILEATFDERP